MTNASFNLLLVFSVSSFVMFPLFLKSNNLLAAKKFFSQLTQLQCGLGAKELQETKHKLLVQTADMLQVPQLILSGLLKVTSTLLIFHMFLS